MYEKKYAEQDIIGGNLQINLFRESIKTYLKQGNKEIGKYACDTAWEAQSKQNAETPKICN